MTNPDSDIKPAAACLTSGARTITGSPAPKQLSSSSSIIANNFKPIIGK